MNKQSLSSLTKFALASYRVGHRWLGIGPGNVVFENAYFAYKYLYEDSLVSHLKGRKIPGYVLDVGANIGFSSWLFQRTIQGKGRVFAFEPEPDNFERLQHRARSWSRVECVRTAVGARTGTTRLWINPDHPGDHRIEVDQPGVHIEVPIVTVDDFLKERGLEPEEITFVKVDVQGAERQVFEGMTGLLAKNPGVEIVFEVDPTFGGPDALIPLLHHLSPIARATVPIGPLTWVSRSVH